MTNFFWSLRLPPTALGAFRVSDLMWDSLPFGWNRSLVIAQRTLGRLLSMALAAAGLTPLVGVTLFLFHYYDDVLVLAASAALTNAATLAVNSFLTLHNVLISPKSVTIPTQDVVWLGKRYDLTARAVTYRPAVLLHTLALTVLCQ